MASPLGIGESVGFLGRRVPTADMAESDCLTRILTHHAGNWQSQPKAGGRSRWLPHLSAGNVLRARRPQEADDSEVVDAVLPFSELDPPDESPGVPELEEVFFDEVVVLVPDDSEGSDLRESLR